MSGGEVERYAYDEPTPADKVLSTSDGSYIIRMGEPPIPVGCGATCAEEIPDDERKGGA
jgi:hypothetical protein